MDQRWTPRQFMIFMAAAGLCGQPCLVNASERSKYAYIFCLLDSEPRAASQ